MAHFHGGSDMAVYLAWRTVSCLGWLLSEEAGTRDLLISYRPEIKGQGQKLARLYPQGPPQVAQFLSPGFVL